jgi:sporulation protein YlmC with PRC-barrel domain
MLQLSDAVLNKPILSLRTGSAVAQVMAPIINPDNLKIEGFYCQDNAENKQLILLYQDIRDLLPQGLVINDYDVLAEPEDLVRLKKILEIDFELMGKPVETMSHEKVGKVNDYAFESATMFIQKLYISQSLLKSLTGGSLSVDRNQIQEITPKRIIINDLLNTAPAAGAAAAA